MHPDALLIEMSHNLGIKISHIECANEWKQRVILSACSAWILEIVRRASVCLSVAQVKNKLADKVYAYLELFQSDMAIINTEEGINNIVEYIYKVHLEIGSLYHRSYYVYPAKERMNTCYGVALYRSPTYPLKLYFSGLGTYALSEEIVMEKPDNLYMCYLLPGERPAEILSELVKARKWHLQTDFQSIEFLNVSRKYGEGYYTKKPFDTDELNLSRETVEYRERYALRRGNLQYDIQEWEQDECVHEYVSLALMQKLHARVLVDSSLVKINLDYSLPKPEEAFLRLYSWPCSLSQLDDRWNFWMIPAIYPIMKKRLAHLGFIIREESV